jgi:hypothetical protein
MKRRQITIEEVEKFIADSEAYLAEHPNEPDASRIRSKIEIQKKTLEGMRAGTTRIFQRIPQKITK